MQANMSHISNTEIIQDIYRYTGKLSLYRKGIGCGFLKWKLRDKHTALRIDLQNIDQALEEAEEGIVFFQYSGDSM